MDYMIMDSEEMREREFMRKMEYDFVCFNVFLIFMIHGIAATLC